MVLKIFRQIYKFYSPKFKKKRKFYAKLLSKIFFVGRFVILCNVIGQITYGSDPFCVWENKVFCDDYDVFFFFHGLNCSVPHKAVWIDRMPVKHVTFHSISFKWHSTWKPIFRHSRGLYYVFSVVTYCYMINNNLLSDDFQIKIV